MIGLAIICAQVASSCTVEQTVPPTEEQGHDEHEHMHHGSMASKDYTWDISIPPTAAPGKTTEISMLIKEADDGIPVRNLTEQHKKLAHLIVVSKDLLFFDHIHPEIVGPGKMSVKATFPRPGEYIAFLQFATPDKGEQLLRAPIRLGKEEMNAASLTPDSDKDKTMDGLTFRLHSPPVKAHQMSMPEVEITRAGKAVTDIEEYLGAGGHGVIISQDTQSFLHVHPEASQAADGTYSSPVMFHTEIPAAGAYKMWTQFMIDGKVRTADFTFKVSQ